MKAPLAKLLPASLLLALLAVGSGFGLDAAAGRVRLTLIEGIGRFSIFCQKASSGAFTPLLATQDPRTSVLSIVYGNRIYRMGESSEFSEKAERIPGGARFVWRSPFLQVTESFTFLPARDSDVSTGVRIDLSMKNLSEQDISVGARYLFDTYLGEPSGVHFRTSKLPQVTRELTIVPANNVAWWESPLAGDKDGFGLEVPLIGEGITTPDRVVFANWKRLSDSSWSYDTSTARNFSQLPYSVNDSAAAQYYDPRTVPRSGEVTVTLVLGLYSKAGYDATAVSVASSAPAPAAGFQSGVQQSLNAGQNAASDAQAVQADLSAVDAILDEIDARLGAGGSMPDGELALIESALKDLGSRAGRFTSAPAR